MITMRKHINKKGIEAMENRLNTLLKLLKCKKEKDYPMRFQMFGYPILMIGNPEELKGRILELKDVLNIINITEVIGNGNRKPNNE